MDLQKRLILQTTVGNNPLLTVYKWNCIPNFSFRTLFSVLEKLSADCHSAPLRHKNNKLDIGSQTKANWILWWPKVIKYKRRADKV